MSYRFKQNYYVKERCECGGTRRIKDHGTWVGYHCPSCKDGGSQSKNKPFGKKNNKKAQTLGLTPWSRPLQNEPEVSMDAFMENDEPMSLMEFCKIESGGLTGRALRRYVSRYYGLD